MAILATEHEARSLCVSRNNARLRIARRIDIAFAEAAIREADEAVEAMAALRSRLQARRDEVMRLVPRAVTR